MRRMMRRRRNKLQNGDLRFQIENLGFPRDNDQPMQSEISNLQSAISRSIPGGFDGGQFVRDRLLLYLRAGYQHYGEHNDRAAQQDEAIHVLMQNQPAQEHSHDGVYVGISRNFRRGHMLEQPDVGGVSNPRAAHYHRDGGARSARGPETSEEVSRST